MPGSTARGEAYLAPGPTGNPITEQLRPFEHDPLGFLLRMQQSYGDVVRLHLWPRLCFLVSEPSAVRHILVTRAANYHGPPAMQRGLPRPAGSVDAAEAHAEQLELTELMEALGRKHFHRKDVVARLPAIVAAVSEHLRAWAVRAAGGAVLDLERAIVALSQAVLGSVLLRADLAAAGPVLQEAISLVPPHRGVSVLQRLERASEEQRQAARSASDRLDTIVHDLIAARRRAEPHEDDLLSFLIFHRNARTGHPLNEALLQQAVAVFLIAGHSAVASALTWACYLLARHPAWADRLALEVDAVLGGRAPDMASLSALPLTARVLQEALRLYPPVWLLAPRLAVRADTLNGFAVPAGATILISPYVLHRRVASWKDPEVFRPDRFEVPPPPAYLPFGAGPWGCLGSAFGQLETEIALAMIVQRFRWTLPPDYTLTLDPQLALRPRAGLPVRLEERTALGSRVAADAGSGR